MRCCPRRPGPPDSGATYSLAWHPVGLGSDTLAPTYLAVRGGARHGCCSASAERAVDLLLLAAVPLAGLIAYLALRRVVAAVPLRVWGAATYALLPSVVGAVAAGRLSTAVVAVLLPLTLLLAGRALGRRRRSRRLAGCLGGRAAARGA